MTLTRFSMVMTSLTLAGGILCVSVFRSASARYVFTGPVSQTAMSTESGKFTVDYVFPYPGNIDPSDPMWEVKAARDKIWLATTTSHSKRGEIALLQADKRLMMAKHLIEEKEYEMGIDTLTKSQMYLQTAVSEIRTAQKDGEYVKDLLEKVSLATVAHRKEIEIMIANCPEDARPTIEKLSDSVKRLYQDTTTYVIEAGGTPPKNPFQ